MLPAVPVWDTVLWFSHNHLPALCLGQSRRSIIKSWLFSMNGKISIIKLPCNFLAGYQLVRWLKVDQPQIAVEYLGKDECQGQQTLIWTHVTTLTLCLSEERHMLLHFRHISTMAEMEISSPHSVLLSNVHWSPSLVHSMFSLQMAFWPESWANSNFCRNN